MARGWSKQKAAERKALRYVPMMLLGLNRSKHLGGASGIYNGRPITKRIVVLPAKKNLRLQGDFHLRHSHVDKRASRRPARQNVADREYQPRPSTVGAMSEGNGSAKLTGTVKFFNPDKGYGFIRRDGGQDVFVHANDLRKSGIVDLSPVVTGAKLEFSTEIAQKGPKAVGIRLLPEVPASSAAV